MSFVICISLPVFVLSLCLYIYTLLKSSTFPGKTHSLSFTFQLKTLLFLPFPFILLKWFASLLNYWPGRPQITQDHNSEATGFISCMKSLWKQPWAWDKFLKMVQGNPAGKCWTCLGKTNKQTKKPLQKELSGVTAGYFKIDGMGAVSFQVGKNLCLK